MIQWWDQFKKSRAVQYSRQVYKDLDNYGYGWLQVETSDRKIIP